MIPTFSGVFTQQEGLDESAVTAAVEVMQSGRLHRYNQIGDEPTHATSLEAEFAAYQGQAYCLACASGGAALQIALRAVGVEADQPVLSNAFTLAPVPGAIAAVGARPILVETTTDLVIDIVDLARKIEATGARILLLSHMRGHLADMAAIGRLVEQHDLTLIEDCAHTMGARFDGRPSGSTGHVACFSTQSYKHLNSGEGGFLTTNDELIAARAIVLSGSYMLYGRHSAAPDESVFRQVRLDMPNCSARMDNLRAALLRPQLTRLDDNAARWNARYRALADVLDACPHVRLPKAHPRAEPVMSSLQFSIERFSAEHCARFVSLCLEHGVELKWFGAAEPNAYTSRHDSWRYVEAQALPQTDHVLSTLFDCRLPLTFSEEDCRMIGTIVVAVIESMMRERR